MSIRSLLPCAFFVIPLACGAGTPPAEAPPSDPAKGKADMAAEPSAETPGDSAEKGEGAPKAEEKQAEPAPKLDKPKSASTISGKSLSEIDGVAVQAEAKKLGWSKDGAAVGGGTMGSYEQFRFDIERGKLKGFIEIVRPAASPTPAGSGGMTPPAELKGTREKEGAAVHLDEASDVIVIVSIEGKSADAKKLLGQLVKIVKAAAKAEKKAEPAKPAEPAKK